MPVSPTTFPAASRPDRWRPFTAVATAGFRSAAYFGLQAFVPLYFINQLHSSTAIGNTALTVLLVAPNRIGVASGITLGAATGELKE